MLDGLVGVFNEMHEEHDDKSAAADARRGDMPEGVLVQVYETYVLITRSHKRGYRCTAAQHSAGARLSVVSPPALALISP
jgi:hypothetical protein